MVAAAEKLVTSTFGLKIERGHRSQLQRAGRHGHCVTYA